MPQCIKTALCHIYKCTTYMYIDYWFIGIDYIIAGEIKLFS